MDWLWWQSFSSHEGVLMLFYPDGNIIFFENRLECSSYSSVPNIMSHCLWDFFHEIVSANIVMSLYIVVTPICDSLSCIIWDVCFHLSSSRIFCGARTCFGSTSPQTKNPSSHWNVKLSCEAVQFYSDVLLPHVVSNGHEDQGICHWCVHLKMIEVINGLTNHRITSSTEQHFYVHGLPLCWNNDPCNGKIQD